MGEYAIIGDRLAPYFNEAVANQMNVFSKEIGARIFTCNDIGFRPFMRQGQYTIVNSRFLQRGTPILSYINGFLILLLLKVFSMRYSKIIVAGGVDSEFLRYIRPEKCIPFITTIQNDKRIQSRVLQKYPLIFVQTEKDRQRLMENGASSDKVVKRCPMLDLPAFRPCPPPDTHEFRILFASAPNTEILGEDNYSDKGLPILLEAFKKIVCKYVNAKLYVVWRGKYKQQLYKDIQHFELGDNVIILDSMVNMPEMYSKIHATVIPYLNSWRSPEIPLSALESLISHRPIVVTDVVEIADMVRKNGCGTVCKPTAESIFEGLLKVIDNYCIYYVQCQNFREKYERHRKTSLILSHNNQSGD